MAATKGWQKQNHTVRWGLSKCTPSYSDSSVSPQVGPEELLELQVIFTCQKSFLHRKWMLWRVDPNLVFPLPKFYLQSPGIFQHRVGNPAYRRCVHLLELHSFGKSCNKPSWRKRVLRTGKAWEVDSVEVLLKIVLQFVNKGRAENLCGDKVVNKLNSQTWFLCPDRFRSTEPSLPSALFRNIKFVGEK